MDFPRSGGGFAALWLLGAAGGGSAGLTHISEPSAKKETEPISPDAWISKPLMWGGVCGFCCVSKVWLCALSLALSPFYFLLIRHTRALLFKEGFVSTRVVWVMSETHKTR